MSSALDYSYARPDPTVIVEHGYTVVLRYLGRDARCIDRAELERLHAAGLLVGLIGQTTVTRPRSGYNGGLEDARRYNQLADEIGAPDWLPIFYVCDVGQGFPSVSDYPAIRAYTLGILDTPGRPAGQYGPYPVLEDLSHVVSSTGRRIEHFWQTAGGSGSGQGTGGTIRNRGDGSHRRLTSLACMFQEYGGVVIPDTDHNQILKQPISWAWHPALAREAAEDDMAPPVIQWTKPGSEWARTVAARAAGDEVAAFLAYPSSGIIVHIVSEEQLNSLLYVGVKSLDHLDDKWFYGYAYHPHTPATSSPATVTPGAILDEAARRLAA